MNRTIRTAVLALALLWLAACGAQDGGPAQVVRANLEAMAAGDYDAWLATLEAERQSGFSREDNGELGVLTLTINSVVTVDDSQHVGLILESENARRLGLTADNIALVDADYDVQYDGAKVPHSSGNMRWRYVLIRRDESSPWLIRDWGYGRGGV